MNNQRDLDNEPFDETNEDLPFHSINPLKAPFVPLGMTLEAIEVNEESKSSVSVF